MHGPGGFEVSRQSPGKEEGRDVGLKLRVYAVKKAFECIGPADYMLLFEPCSTKCT